MPKCDWNGQRVAVLVGAVLSHTVCDVQQCMIANIQWLYLYVGISVQRLIQRTTWLTVRTERLFTSCQAQSMASSLSFRTVRLDNTRTPLDGALSRRQLLIICKAFGISYGVTCEWIKGRRGYQHHSGWWHLDGIFTSWVVLMDNERMRPVDHT